MRYTLGPAFHGLGRREKVGLPLYSTSLKNRSQQEPLKGQKSDRPGCMVPWLREF